MPKSSYERVKRWREKHRGLANLRQREYRKGIANEPEQAMEVAVAPKSTIEELRALVAAESAKPAPVAESTVAPRVFRDDYGRVISEAQWSELQKRKSDAADGGYVIDEFSQ